MKDYFTKKVSEGRDLVANLESQLIAARASLVAYEDALKHATGDAPPKPKGNGHAGAPHAERSGAIPSEMTPGWRRVLRKVGDSEKSFDAADVVYACNIEGVPAKMTNARSQIYQWQVKHLIQRVRKGKYRLTPSGQEAVKKTEGPEAGATEPS
jgi:hypothetical protein